MTRCLTFQCQEQIPGLGSCELRTKYDQMQPALVGLIDRAMPMNWYEDDLDPEHVAAWRAAMVAVGIDPETMKEAG